MRFSFIDAETMEQLQTGLPGRGRALAEALFLLGLVFLPGLVAPLGRIALFLATVGLVVLGERLMALERGWRERGLLPTLGWFFALALGLFGALAEPWLGPSSVPRHARLGVTVLPSPAEATAEGGALVVTGVRPGLPAQGRLERGDVLLSLEGRPFPRTRTEEEFRRRIDAAGEGSAVPLSFLVARNGEKRLVTVPVGPRAGTLERLGEGMGWLCFRAVGVLVLVALLVRRDGQGPAQLGLFRSGLGRDLLWAGPVLVGTYVTLLAVSLPLTIIGTLFGIAQRELETRRAVADALVGTGLSVPAFFLAMLLVTGFEEVAFRGFLLPRLRQIVGSWGGALALMAVLFGLGHVYEGTLAILQTAALGAFFGAAYLYRGKLATVILAHAAFNSVSYAAMLYLQRSGLLERLPRMLER